MLSININHKIGDNGVVLDRIIWPLVGSEINTDKERMAKKMLRLENLILTKKMSFRERKIFSDEKMRRVKRVNPNPNPLFTKWLNEFRVGRGHAKS